MENAPDDLASIKEKIGTGIAQADLVLLSGGSSVGTMDFTLSAINESGEPGVLVHGLSIKPGKPTIYGIVDGTPIIGLPGHPVGALVVFFLFVVPLIGRIGGEDAASFLQNPTPATITRSLAGSPGKDAYFPVAITEPQGEDRRLSVTPILGKSGMISILTKSSGLIRIPPSREGVSAGDVVYVYRYGVV
jgi:molybdopterin molybdotransferase